jgi:hypothetical protein
MLICMQASTTPAAAASHDPRAAPVHLAAEDMHAISLAPLLDIVTCPITKVCTICSLLFTSTHSKPYLSKW